MGTVDKALALLRHFSAQRREIGLSDLARSAGYDKTTTLRLMASLSRYGFVEQDAGSRKYRLGLAPLSLARIREASFPIEAVLKPRLDHLARSLGETAHATLISGSELLTVHVSEPDCALRIHVDPAAPMPAHATASGMALAAYLPKDRRAALLNATRFEQFTPTTPKDAQSLASRFEKIRKNGFSRADDTFEDGVTGTAVPFFDAAGLPQGAIAVAAVTSRFDAALARRVETDLLRTAREITDALGGTRPKSDTARQMETAS